MCFQNIKCLPVSEIYCHDTYSFFLTLHFGSVSHFYSMYNTGFHFPIVFPLLQCDTRGEEGWFLEAESTVDRLRLSQKTPSAYWRRIFFPYPKSHIMHQLPKQTRAFHYCDTWTESTTRWLYISFQSSLSLHP